jgi:predicted dehydrogenase
LIQLAVAGAGAWGRNHIRSVCEIRGANLRWVIEPDAERRAQVETLAPQARLTGEAAEALADPRLDGLVVASPTPTHVPLARAALAAGKHVLVEKPLAPDADLAWDLVRRARRAKRLLAVGHLLLYHPGLRRLKAMLAAGQLGRPYYATSQRTNLGRIRTDEGTLTSLGPHDVSVMSWLFDAWPTAVSARGAAYVQPAWEDVVFLDLFYPRGVLGHVHLSWLDPQKVRRMSVVGSRKMAVFDDLDPEGLLKIHDKSALVDGNHDPTLDALRVREGVTRVVRVPDRPPLAIELAAFATSIRTGRPCPTPGEDGARVARVLDAAQASLSEGGRRMPVRIR